MKTRLLLAALVGLSLAFAQGVLSADEEAKEFKASCPVSGGPAKAENAVAYAGKEVYFCCKNCPKAFSANTEKFANKANHQLVQTGQAVQVGCPMSGRKVNPDTAIDVAGVSVAFCCENCQGKAESSDDALALIFGNFAKGFTVQTLCPVSNKPINPEQSVEHDGKNVYFCCGGCPQAFKDDPEKFVAKLPQFSDSK